MTTFISQFSVSNITFYGGWMRKTSCICPANHYNFYTVLIIVLTASNLSFSKTLHDSPKWLFFTEPAAKTVSFGKAKPTFDATHWQLEKDADGVQIYVRQMDGISYRQVKAVTKVAASLGGMVSLIKDDQASPQWMDRVEKFETVKQISTSEWYTYAEVGIPWPFKNIDMVTQNTLSQATDRNVTISIRNVPGFLPKRKDKSRVIRAQGSWLLIPKKDGVLVEYIFQAKPEGIALPPWLVNSLTVHSFHRGIGRMRKLAETEKYKNAALDYIRE